MGNRNLRKGRRRKRVGERMEKEKGEVNDLN